MAPDAGNLAARRSPMAVGRPGAGCTRPAPLLSAVSGLFTCSRSLDSALCRTSAGGTVLFRTVGLTLADRVTVNRDIPVLRRCRTAVLRRLRLQTDDVQPEEQSFEKITVHDQRPERRR